MSKTTRLIANIVIISISAIISTALIFFQRDMGAFYQIVKGILLAITIFILALALTKDSSIPDILRSDNKKGAGILKNIPFVRFFIAIIVYVIFEAGALIVPIVTAIAREGGDLTAAILLISAYEAVKWYAVFLILTIKAEKSVNVIGMILAFALPYIIVIAQNALYLHNYHIIVNNGGGLITTMNAFIFNKYSQDSIISMLFETIFTAAIPVIYVIIGHLMRNNKGKCYDT